VTTAQAILESGYGTTTLGMEANNLFGMKAQLSANTWSSPWTGKVFIKSTQEYLDQQWYTVTDTFRAYESYAQSLADHSAYLAGAMNGTKLRYEGVVGNTSYKKTIRLIKNGGYATDPDYVTKICNIITRYNLTQYDK
jgi:flagellum-specific peptidoglycan hydrolase FlgJ